MCSHSSDKTLEDVVRKISVTSLYLFKFHHYEMRYAIWFNLYNLKNVKNIYGGMLLSVKLQAFRVSSKGAFQVFKLNKHYQIMQRITMIFLPH